MLTVRSITPAEEQQLHELLDHSQMEVRRRAKAVLLSAQGYSANEMVPWVNLTAKSIRKWLTRFNAQGVLGLTHQRSSPGRPATLTAPHRQRIQQVALTPPQGLGKPFTTWSLAKLQEHLKQEGIAISKSWLWQILREQGLSRQRAKRWITSPDPEYALKKSESRTWSKRRLRTAR